MNSADKQGQGRDTPRLRRGLMLLGTGLALVLLLLFFRKILLPFIFAFFIVYVTEPLIRRIMDKKIRGRKIPRWGAITSIYVSFLLLVTLFGFYAAPKLAREFSRLFAEAPKFFQTIKKSWVPKVNSWLKKVLDKFNPPTKKMKKIAEKGNEAKDSKALAPPVRAQDPPPRTLIPPGKHAITSRAYAPNPRAGAPPGKAVVAIKAPGGKSMAEKVAKPAVAPGGKSMAEKVAKPVLAKKPKHRRAVLLVERLSKDKFAIILEDTALTVRKLDDDRYALVARPKNPSSVKRKTFKIDILDTVKKKLNNLVETIGSHFTDFIVIGKEMAVGALGAFLTIFLTFVLAIFISIDVNNVHRFFRSLVPRTMHEDYDHVMGELDKGLTGVIRGQLLICLINGLLTAFGLYMGGVKFAGILALLACVMTLIPIFGTILSSIPMMIIALSQSEPAGIFGLSGVGLAIYIAIWIAAIHSLETYVLEPKIFGHHARIHPALVIFALIAGEYMFGLVGLIFAVPVMSIVKTLFLFLKGKMYGEEEMATEKEKAPP